MNNNNIKIIDEGDNLNTDINKKGVYEKNNTSNFPVIMITINIY